MNKTICEQYEEQKSALHKKIIEDIECFEKNTGTIVNAIGINLSNIEHKRNSSLALDTDITKTVFMTSTI